MISIRLRDVEFTIFDDMTIGVTVTMDGEQDIITLEELEQVTKIAQIMKRDFEVRNASRTV